MLHAPATSALSTNVNLTTTAITRSCDDIHTCRTLYSIVQTCLATIFAPVFDPNPNHVPISKAARWFWSKIRDLRQPVIVFSVTLLAPEWVLAWAVRQRLRAGKLVKELEKARAEATEQWGTPGRVEDQDTGVSGRGSSENLIEKESSASGEPSHPAHTENQCAWFSARSVGKLGQAWTKAHAFFAIMGGYQACDEKGPIHPLHPDKVVELVREARLVPPTGDELSNQSKGDVLSKGVAVIQTVWFVVQCIARLVEDLPLTNLEVMTLAYTVMTVAMYVAWWDKPLNISCATRVQGAPVKGQASNENAWQTMFSYVIGDQDNIVDLRYLQRVPTFWAGEPDVNDFIGADIIALVVAMAFGAVHCIAWSYPFASPAERFMWRASAIAIIVIPAGLLIGLTLIPGHVDSRPRTFTVFGLSILGAPVYICARAILLVLSFTTLKALSYQVYKTVQWTDFIPHI
ncbi:hypothetical protein HWV62_26166 [Athelia sp. TMB]|nr:hypothetical protein HWV62_26166 [Athelia sp. TMB]